MISPGSVDSFALIKRTEVTAFAYRRDSSEQVDGFGELIPSGFGFGVGNDEVALGVVISDDLLFAGLDHCLESRVIEFDILEGVDICFVGCLSDAFGLDGVGREESSVEAVTDEEIDGEGIGVHRRRSGGYILGEDIGGTGDDEPAVVRCGAAVFGSQCVHLRDELAVCPFGDLIIEHHSGQRDAFFVIGMNAGRFDLCERVSAGEHGSKG